MAGAATAQPRVWTLLPYQARWVRDAAPLKVCIKSRRIGISWAEAADAVLRSGAQGGGDTTYQSYARDMTAGWIGDCQHWASDLQAVAGEVGERLIADEDGRERTLYSIRMASGQTIESVTAAPRQFRSRGRPGDVAIIDEAALVDDLAEVLKAAMAYRIWGGRVHVISTPKGVGGPFHRLCEEIADGSRPGSLHTVTLADALADGLYRRICEVTGQPWSPEAEAEWERDLRAQYGEDAAEELDCIPADGAGRWLAWDLIRGAEHPDAGDPGLYSPPLGVTYLGNDIARRRHLWVSWVLQVVGDVAWTREVVTMSGATFAAQDAALDALVHRYQPVSIAMDRTGIGAKPVEDAAARYGASRVEGVDFSSARKHDLAIALRERLEDGRLRIPAGDAALREDLRSVRREYGPTGAARLVADETSEGDGGRSHADRFWALALACGAAAQRRRGPIRGRVAAASDTSRVMDAYAPRTVGPRATGAPAVAPSETDLLLGDLDRGQA